MYLYINIYKKLNMIMKKYKNNSNVYEKNISNIFLLFLNKQKNK